MVVFCEPKNVKLFFGFFYSSGQIYQTTRDLSIKEYGSLDFESEAADFKFTDYYREEMGSNLKRRFISFKKLIHPQEIIEAKLFSAKIEKKFCLVNKRRINIDPGYINDAKIVLSTTKDFSHRIYLGKKVFAEITLLYKNKGFRNLPWTYPDFRTKPYKDIFIKMRSLYKEQLKKNLPVKIPVIS